MRSLENSLNDTENQARFPIQQPGHHLLHHDPVTMRDPTPSTEEQRRMAALEEAREDSRRFRGVMPTYNIKFPSPPKWASCFSPRGFAALRIFMIHIEELLRLPIKLIMWVVTTLLWLIGLIVAYTLIYILVGGLILYFSQLFWPLVLSLFLDVVLPLANILIIVFNFVLILVITVTRILFMIWNMLVPFIFMVLDIVLDLFITIMGAVFEIIGSEAFQDVIQALMAVIFILVDIAVQILVVLIQVGIGILKALEAIISLLLEAVLAVVDILLPIVMWIVGFLFDILEPILMLVQALVSAFSWMLVAQRSFTSRKLLFVDLLETEEDYLNFRYVADEEALDPRKIQAAHLTDIYDFWDSTRSPNDTAIRDDFSIMEYARRGHWRVPDPAVEEGFRTSRKLFSAEEKDTRHETFSKANAKAGKEGANGIDDTTHLVTRTLHQGVHNMVRSGGDVGKMHEILTVINNYRRKPRHHFSMENIVKRMRMKDSSIRTNAVRGPASAARETGPAHPHTMEVSFHKKLKDYREQHDLPHSIAYMSGRKLLDLSNKNQWDGRKRLHAQEHNRLELEYANRIMEHGKAYEEHHTKRIKMVHVIHNAVRTTMLKHAETTLSYDNIAHHTNELMKQFGYQSAWDVYHEFMSTHKTTDAYMKSINEWLHTTEMFQFFKERDPERFSRPFAHDWSQMEAHEQEAHYDQYHRYSGATSRRTLATNFQDDNLDTPDKQKSQEMQTQNPLVSKRTCYSSPRHLFCLPEIPQNFGFTVPQIPIPKIDENEECVPWRNTNCILCVARFYNAWQSFRYIISAIPLFNFPLTWFATLVPWASFLVDWVFLVPMGRFTTFFLFMCFVKHLYDVFVVYFLVFLLLKIFVPLVKIFVEFFTRVWNRDRSVANKYRDDMMNTDKETAKLNRLFSQLTSAAQYQWFNDGTWFPQYLHGNPRGYDFYGGAGVPYSVGGLRTGDDEEQEDSIGVQLSLQHGEHHEERARRALRNLHARGVSQSALRRMQANILARLDHDFEISRTTPQHSHDVDVALTELYTTHPLLFDVSNLTHPPESRSSENSSSSVVELELEDEEDQRRIAASISSSSTGSARAQRPEREDFDDTIIDMKVLQI